MVVIKKKLIVFFCSQATSALRFPPYDMIYKATAVVAAEHFCLRLFSSKNAKS